MTTWPMIALDTALYDLLAADATVSGLVGVDIWKLQAPATTQLPYVVFYRASAVQANTTPRVDHDVLYRVEAYAISQSAAMSLQQAIHDALHRVTLTVSGWVNYWTAHEDTFQFVEDLQKGAQVWRYTGDYRIKLSKTQSGFSDGFDSGFS